MIRVFQTIEQARDQEIPVLITGETGTGKELVARAIYSRSPRSRGPFQALHGASVPEELFESELFGYQAGAFTGAEEDHAGLLEQLNGGTLLLDEVGEIPQRAQAKILRVLDSGVIRRLGSVQSREIDVRFLFTSTRDIQEAVNEGVFRRDLYYRLRGLEIRIPPLQERRADVQLLARHFLEKHAGRLDRPVPAIGRDALRVLEEHSWPGNVRELESLLLRVLVTLSAGQDLRAADLEEIGRKLPDQVGRGLLHQSLEDWRADLDRRYLTELFLDVRGNVKEMIERLGIRRTTLYLWFKKLSIDIKELRRRL